MPGLKKKKDFVGILESRWKAEFRRTLLTVYKLYRNDRAYISTGKEAE